MVLENDVKRIILGGRRCQSSGYHHFTAGHAIITGCANHCHQVEEIIAELFLAIIEGLKPVSPRKEQQPGGESVSDRGVRVTD